MFLSVVLFVTCQVDSIEDGLVEPPAHYVSKRFQLFGNNCYLTSTFIEIQRGKVLVIILYKREIRNLNQRGKMLRNHKRKDRRGRKSRSERRNLIPDQNQEKRLL